MIVSGCTVPWGVTLGKDARGHLPWYALYVQFTTDLLQTNEGVRNLHEKSLKRDRGSAGFSCEIRSDDVLTYVCIG